MFKKLTATFLVLVFLVITPLSGQKAYAFVETAIDVASFADSSIACAATPGIGTCGMALFDGISILFPGLPSSGTVKIGTKVFNKADDAVKAAKTLKKTNKAAKAYLKVPSTIAELNKADGLVIGKYSKTYKNVTAGKQGSVQAHHIIEKRLADRLGFKPDNMQAVVISKDLHNDISKRWIDNLPKNGKYNSLKKSDIKKIIEEVYKDVPILKKEALDELAKAAK
jgi:hypothetical protein